MRAVTLQLPAKSSCSCDRWSVTDERGIRPSPTTQHTSVFAPRSAFRCSIASRALSPHPGVSRASRKQRVRQQIAASGLPEVASAASAVATTGTTFETAPPGMGAQQLIALAVCVSPALYWWFVLVPSERQSLAKNKRRGEVQDYLAEIEGDEGRSLERWFYTDWLQQRGREQERREKNKRLRPQAAASNEASTISPDAASTSISSTAAPGTHGPTSVATSTTSDSATPPSVDEKAVEAEQEPYDGSPYVATPDFWSGDNPILVTAVLLAVAVTVGAISHAR